MFMEEYENHLKEDWFVVTKRNLASACQVWTRSEGVGIELWAYHDPGPMILYAHTRLNLYVYRLTTEETDDPWRALKFNSYTYNLRQFYKKSSLPVAQPVANSSAFSYCY